jgi:hypothetical protein
MTSSGEEAFMSRRKIRTFGIAVSCCLGLLLAVRVNAQVPKKMNYQGRITDNLTGMPLSGTHDMTFRIFDVQSAGTALWYESQTVESDSAGVLSVVLGNTEPLGIDFDRALWLEVEVDGEVLRPRRELTCVPYALYALEAGGVTSLDAADGDPADVVYVDSDGNVGIGTTTPDKKLDVAGSLRLSHNQGMSFGDDATRIYHSGADLYARSYDDIHLRPDGNLYVGTGTANWAVFDTGLERLGIGTTSPSEALDVVGRARITSSAGSPLRLYSTGSSYLEFDTPGPGPMGLRLENSHGAMYLAHGVDGENRLGLLNADPDKEVLSIDWETNNVGIWESEPDTGAVIDLNAWGRTVGLSATGARDFPIWAEYTGNQPGAAIAARNHGSQGSALEAVAEAGFAAVEARGGEGVQYAVFADADGAEYAGYFNGQVGINETSDDLIIPLVISDNAYTNGQQTVSIQLTDAPAGGHDLLQLRSSVDSPMDFQFIECEIPTPAIDVKFSVWGDGHVTADGEYGSNGAGLAEMIEVASGASTVEAGDVLVIDAAGTLAVEKSTAARSSLVAGIYTTKPGFVGAETEWDRLSTADGEGPEGITLLDMAAEFDEIPMAVAGIVPCKVSAENGSIQPGDLLVTSATPGHAMRDEDPDVGTVLGKALEPLAAGTGTIRVLVTLH